MRHAALMRYRVQPMPNCVDIVKMLPALLLSEVRYSEVVSACGSHLCMFWQNLLNISV